MGFSEMRTLVVQFVLLNSSVSTCPYLLPTPFPRKFQSVVETKKNIGIQLYMLHCKIAVIVASISFVFVSPSFSSASENFSASSEIMTVARVARWLRDA